MSNYDQKGIYRRDRKYVLSAKLEQVYNADLTVKNMKLDSNFVLEANAAYPTLKS